MPVLENKIDFIVLVSVKDANPNGDPLNGNRPRTTYDGYGEMSDVCIKRKIRNRLQDMGEKIFVQSTDRTDDKCTSLNDRLQNLVPDPKKLTHDELATMACETWMDVRSFGQLFAFKNAGTGDGVSASVRGPVSIQQARSITPVDIATLQITKSVNSETTANGKKSTDTMGSKYLIPFGIYEIKGAINVQLAEKTGFTVKDADKIKEALRTLFVNDASAARPDGSMEVLSVYWWKHNCKIGQYSSAKIHDSLNITLKKGIDTPNSIDDYTIELKELKGIKPEIISGI